jgi:hypothetical protein
MSERIKKMYAYTEEYLKVLDEKAICLHRMARTTSSEENLISGQRPAYMIENVPP